MATPSADRLLAIITRLATELHPDGTCIQDITLDSGLDRDLGLDSLARMELLTRLEKEYGVRLPEKVLVTAETPRDLLFHLGNAALVASESEEAENEVRQDESEIRRASGPVGAKTLVEILAHHVRQQPESEHIVLLEGGKEFRITYAMLHAEALKVANRLRDLQLEPGSTVAIMLPTSRDYFFSFFGVLYAGFIPVPLYPPARPTQIEEHVRRHRKIIANAAAPLLITMLEVKPVARLLMSQVVELKRIMTVDELYSDVPTAMPHFPKANDIAFLQYTSGSTGDPKGVVLTHANLMANIRAMGQVCRASAEDVFVSWLPLYHDMGLIGAWFGSLFYGCRLVVMSPLSFIARPERWLRAISRFGGTLSASPNFGYQLCISRLEDKDLAGIDLRSWRMAFNGAEPVIPETLRVFADRFEKFGLSPKALAPVYGLAESSVGLAFPEPGLGARIDTVERNTFGMSGKAVPSKATDGTPLEFVCCGRPLPGHQIRIVDSEGRELPERYEGRLQFKGPSSTSGYFKNADETRKLFVGEWLDSGDLAYIVAGEIYLTGRVKDIIIRAGRNIYPHELEEAVGNVPGVRKGCTAVFAAQNGQESAEKLVVLTESRQRGSEKLQEIRQKISEIAVDLLGTPPDEIIIGPPGTVLKTSSGKIRRSACRNLYISGHIGRTKPAVWMQMARMGLASVKPMLQRLAARLGALVYAGYCWFCLGLVGIVAWCGLQLLPTGQPCWNFAGTLVRWLCRLTGIGITIRGLENLPAEGNYLMVSNHMSYLDAILLTGVLPQRVGFVAKAELGRNPFLVRPLKKLGVFWVDRFDAEQGVADAGRIAQGLSQGARPFFFAEGTLQRMPGLLPFQMGAFVLACEQQVPVVPVVIHGTRNILRGGSWFPRRGWASFTILPSQKNDGRSWQAAIELRNRVRQLMLVQLDEPDLGGEYTSLLQMDIVRPEKNDGQHD
ncbi:AMP-binding protein [Desulfopila aestuarii]|uniref:1-acyl-sn-glycerol-3-phosphate acyltransferases n=1 Tax=Desulfopila aestuarii DSM 18488 TaxID=1121416 RepID=A0A1M7Y2U4_9BACT|nr:AMP-binding protein [Desulfopila aestuarii]SHO46335.1 1-acyl-sn-glycerol-3-phosphate acyltransferases [Desulfopila aestuarii DSM 18488]